MDLEIQNLANLSYDRDLAKKNLKEKQQGRLLLAHEGGLWLCDNNLICLLLSYKHLDQIVLLDSNDIPRKVEPNKLLELVQLRHQEVLNDWLIEYQNLSKIRTVKNVLS